MEELYSEYQCHPCNPWSRSFVIRDLLPQAVSMVENSPVGSNGCDSLARSRVAPAGNP
jgi:hypothetical protein